MSSDNKPTTKSYHYNTRSRTKQIQRETSPISLLPQDLISRIGQHLPFQDRLRCLEAHHKVFAGIMAASTKHTWRLVQESCITDGLVHKARLLLLAKPALQKLDIVILACYRSCRSDIVAQLEQLRAYLPRSVAVRTTIKTNKPVARAILCDPMAHVHCLVVNDMVDAIELQGAISKLVVLDMNVNQLQTLAETDDMLQRFGVRTLELHPAKFDRVCSSAQAGNPSSEAARKTAAVVHMLTQVPKVILVMPRTFGVSLNNGHAIGELVTTLARTATHIQDPSVFYDSIEAMGRLHMYGKFCGRLQTLTFLNLIPSTLLCNRAHFDLFIRELGRRRRQRPATVKLSGYSLRDPNIVSVVLHMVQADPGIPIVIDGNLCGDCEDADPADVLCARLAMRLCQRRLPFGANVFYDMDLDLKNENLSVFMADPSMADPPRVDAAREETEMKTMTNPTDTVAGMLEQLRLLESQSDCLTRVYDLWAIYMAS